MNNSSFERSPQFYARVAGCFYLAIKAHGYGLGIGLIFFGFVCLVRGYLMFVAGASDLTNSFALLLAPSIAAAPFPAVLIPAFVGELSLALWLIVKGVNLRQWEQKVLGRNNSAAA